MGTLIILAILVLVVMGFSNPVWWIAAAALLYLHVRYGHTGPSPSSGGPAGSSGSPARVDESYRAYRQRRDRQARWERRYRRERRWASRQQKG
ncbi:MULTISPECIES: hypothetical protein [Streptomyces aurantiacus group]|uniref:Uncharacterized protein n=1 Tax=Streptomyces flaveus TaxID=66370 RepID=A0A917QL94_9ACTN|nr:MULTISPECIES: hypothetical protein [Streptomyces]GGK56163.1 hypothetical protein GCM10010094_15670 [Streptomyces flaveus]